MNINNIFENIDFKIKPNQDYRKEYFKSGTIILVDDVNFQEVESGTKDFISKYPNEYKIIKDIKTANNHCHPSYWNGLFLFQKK